MAAKSSKKSSAKTATKTRAISSTEARKLVNIDQLGKTVGAAVTRALARQDLSKIRGPILCGIIYRPSTGTFTTVFKEQSQF
jgi:hypothetical protein